MNKIDFTPTKASDRRQPKTDHHCVICRKDITGASCRWVHLIDGGASILHPDSLPAYVTDAGDMGLHPVGMDCAKRLGVEWTREQEQ